MVSPSAKWEHNALFCLENAKGVVGRNLRNLQEFPLCGKRAARPQVTINQAQAKGMCDQVDRYRYILFFFLSHAFKQLNPPGKRGGIWSRTLRFWLSFTSLCLTWANFPFLLCHWICSTALFLPWHWLIYAVYPEQKQSQRTKVFSLSYSQPVGPSPVNQNWKSNTECVSPWCGSLCPSGITLLPVSWLSGWVRLYFCIQFFILPSMCRLVSFSPWEPDETSHTLTPASDLCDMSFSSEGFSGPASTPKAMIFVIIKHDAWSPYPLPV